MKCSLNLSTLLKFIPYTKVINQNNDIVIDNIHWHSKEIKANGLYCALRNSLFDGHQFIQAAINNGAKTILAEVEPSDISSDTIIILSQNSSKAFAKLSRLFYDYPDNKLYVAGITGTNGKTSTTYILEAILNEYGKNTAVTGTINYRYKDFIISTPYTTPEANTYYETLKTMHSKGASHIISEISSHGIALDRIYDLQLDVAIFTNLSHDHLDFHINTDNYYETKKKLFTNTLRSSAKKNKLAIINIDNDYGKKLFSELNALSAKNFRTLSFAINDSKADIFSHDIEQGKTYTLFTISGLRKTFKIETKLIGRHNIQNLLAGISLAIALEIPSKTIQNAIEKITSIPGRLESFSFKNGLRVFIDYAHTPDALEKALITLHPYKTGKLITIFGCGGNRDIKKRALMGNIAAKYSDEIVITSDNPRKEDPEKIITDIVSGLKETQTPYHTIINRRQAIRETILKANFNDIILLAGKGHETYQLIGEQKIEFDERKMLQDLINESKSN